MLAKLRKLTAVSLVLLLVFAKRAVPEEAIAPSPFGVVSGSVWGSISDDDEDAENDAVDDSLVITASAKQPQPAVQPQLQSQPDAPTTRRPELSNLPRSALRSQVSSERQLVGKGQSRIANPASSTIPGAEVPLRAAGDAASVINKTPSSTGVDVQRRTPIVSDPRVRGGRVGQLAASGSHWIPARIDLDTAPSKFDARAIEQIIAIKGPYSALYGPQLHFLEFDLLRSPRFEQQELGHGQTSFEYRSNGQGVYGRQVAFGGDQDWGYRVAYGHKTGNDYYSGAGLQMPASYNSRDVDVAIGGDLTETSTLEVHYLRLDQTNVEFPGQAFDIDFLVTDGWEVEYIQDDLGWCDRFSAEGWYNRTRFRGDAQHPSKRRQFPLFDFYNFIAFTDVDAASMGFKSLASWGDEDDRLVAGVDLRSIKQELNEIASGQFPNLTFDNVNSPIPRSGSTNPGLLVERNVQLTESLKIRSGGRLDYQDNNLRHDVSTYQAIGPQELPLTDILGTTDLAQTFYLWSCFITQECELADDIFLLGGIGHGQRPPNLTEMYAAQSFMFLLQNGANTITGDPLLQPEKMTQFDVGVRWNGEKFRGQVTGYYALAQDYITFENLSVFRNPPFNQIDQVNLKYVNTDLATFVGTELMAEYDATDWLQPFATLQYVAGMDETRDGNFATLEAAPGQPSQRVAGLPRGFYSGLVGVSREPLPGIMPLQSRLGWRFHNLPEQLPWMLEFSCLMVDQQRRVATSLNETETAGYAIFDIRGRWQYSKDLLLISGVENLFNRNYREHLDFRSARGTATFQPGINFYASAQLTY